MLNKIKNPEEIKKLTFKDLEKLATEVRERIIEVSSKNGGHIAPSLGATDITIALLKIFDPLNDRIIWDVGHQSYPYKILTERNEKFDTLRQFDGISGFNNTAESKYDAFSVGHASTSISAALGISLGKNIRQESGSTVAIIGDGALTGGMAFEALNHAGHLQKDMLVILNDNHMSISKTVGGLQSYLAKILVSKFYNKLKDGIWNFFQKLPKRISRRLIIALQTFEENLINTFAPVTIFEEIGFKYVGPIDGHDIEKMSTIFRKAKENMIGPILIHVITQKGKGYHHAENDSTKFHGIAPYEIESGKTVVKNGKSYSKIFGETLSEMAIKNKNIVAITAAMADGTGLSDFAKKFPDRFFDVGIAEQHAITFAGGLATRGLKPFIAIYSTFMQRAIDQIIHDIALQKLPVVLCLDRAGLVGEDGATHHGAFDFSYLNFVPNLVIMAPTCATEFSEMLKFAENFDDGPIAIRYPRGTAIKDNRIIKKIEVGKVEIVKNGEDIAVLGIGKSFDDAEKIVKLLEKDGLNPTLINPRFLKPFDKNSLNNLAINHKIIFTIEDNSLVGGFGSTVKGFFASTDVAVYSFGLPDKFITHGNTEKLREINQLEPQQIYNQIKKIIK
ncbi:MAG: 1-deoxy-D-xylulose-5-phosphate synthase [Candidatus Cloacimonetes bacterium]|jgi:1-deoxy-D-xylulose-5-phosphate synthase|nr:1-deoxy-D-xylulose-5-phosphate synthase [Candidatus Cloacimonadota bacterium]MBT6994345.1 1-deoxy-D-xylulose-5-phosphate synthase [Candidatus Cloacimonadota bacterium]MBT7469299.1 1-deoxy-D-xylulose-5-phosphate synthase [Candidatus Cloacimonadota bacterium]